MKLQFRPRQILIRTTDMSAGLAFYRDVLGLPVAFQDGDRYVAFEPLPISLAMASASEITEPVVVAYRVADVPSATAILVDGGATVVQAPSRTAHEHRAALRDPFGAPLSLYTPIPPPPGQPN